MKLPWQNHSTRLYYLKGDQSYYYIRSAKMEIDIPQASTVSVVRTQELAFGLASCRLELALPDGLFPFAALKGDQFVVLEGLCGDPARFSPGDAIARLEITRITERKIGNLIARYPEESGVVFGILSFECVLEIKVAP